MAKRKPKQKQIEGLQDELVYPADLLEAADDYDSTHKKKAAATAKFNKAKEKFEQLCEQHGVWSVPVRNGEKMLTAVKRTATKFEKPGKDQQTPLMGDPDEGFPASTTTSSKGSSAKQPAKRKRRSVGIESIGLTDNQLTSVKAGGINTTTDLAKLIDSDPDIWHKLLDITKATASRVQKKYEAWLIDG